MRAPLVVDLRNIYRPDEMRARGFDYVGVGSAATQGAEAPRLRKASS
jgi:UDPglucose 6-dehydrogenase